jgi:hypothetical protein
MQPIQAPAQATSKTNIELAREAGFCLDDESSTLYLAFDYEIDRLLELYRAQVLTTLQASEPNL